MYQEHVAITIGTHSLAKLTSAQNLQKRQLKQEIWVLILWKHHFYWERGTSAYSISMKRSRIWLVFKLIVATCMVLVFDTPYSWVEVCRLVAFHKTISNHLEKTHSHVRVKLAIQLHGGEMRTNLGDKKFHIPSYIGWYLIRILCIVFQKKKCDLSFSLISYIWLEKTSFVQQRTYIAQTKNESSAYFLNDRQGNIW